MFDSCKRVAAMPQTFIRFYHSGCFKIASGLWVSTAMSGSDM